MTVIKGKGSRQSRSQFSFDNVFTSFSTQEEVFEATLEPVIDDVFKGFESTVFAYGQTGTGKTHTMEGNLKNSDDYGIIPRSAIKIFEDLRQPQYSNHTIFVSYLEIYNEDLCDLLSSPHPSPPYHHPLTHKHSPFRYAAVLSGRGYLLFGCCVPACFLSVGLVS